MNRSAKGLYTYATLDGFSLVNHKRFAKLSTRQTFPLYGIWLTRYCNSNLYREKLIQIIILISLFTLILWISIQYLSCFPLCCVMYWLCLVPLLYHPPTIYYTILWLFQYYKPGADPSQQRNIYLAQTIIFTASNVTDWWNGFSCHSCYSWNLCDVVSYHAVNNTASWSFVWLHCSVI